ncbi:MAG: gluconate 2-dehydrogenase subunit 3 family protein [Chloroflexota bacterium]|nr:gluconate 2-dehydrogenase subunit 3 family protein [Chloroflexota bacterium]
MPISDRYPGADALAQRGHWDDATREVVLDRVRNVPAFRFFNPAERATLAALCDIVVPQDHRTTERRIPIAPWIDQRCAERIGDGFRLETMPANETAWRRGLAGLDQSARALCAAGFADLSSEQQTRVVETIRQGDARGAIWQHMSSRHWWIFVALRQITGVYYAHPYAWDEIGFGGPAYPRGYFALNAGYPEPWEAREVGERRTP